MHAIDVGIGCDDHLLVAQRIEALLNVEGALQAVELIVLVDDFLAQAEGVQGFAFEAEYGLSIHVSSFGDGSASGVALYDEKHGFVGLFMLRVEVSPAIAEFLVVQVDLLGLFAGEFTNSREFFAFFFAGDDLLLDGFGRMGELVKVKIELPLDEIVDEVADARALGAHVLRS